jgi:tetratricopeptide (TPR) repeat protein
MKRLTTRLGALVLMLMLPAVAFAQKEPPHTKETKNAEKFIGLAMTRQDAAQRKQFLEQAMPPLREAMQKDPENARVWVLAGSVFAGLGDLVAADSAFDKAVALHPGYGEQVTVERHAAWEVAFNNAVGLINAQQTDQGIVALENAEAIFADRPEAKFYLGLFYSQKQQLDKAEKALEGAIAAVNGPLRAKLQPAAAEEWDRMATNAKIKLSNIMAMRGAELYDKQQFNEAAATFAKAREVSRSSRDHLFNQLQSAYARALDLDKERAEKKSAALDTEAKTLYTSILTLTNDLRQYDPRNEDIFFFSSRAHKVLSELAADAAAKNKHLESLRGINTEYEQMTFLVSDVQISEADTTATVNGNVYVKTLKPGATGTFTFELLGFDGGSIGSAPVNFTVPAGAAKPNEPVKVPFTVTVPMKAPLAGWRYK